MTTDELNNIMKHIEFELPLNVDYLKLAVACIEASCVRGNYQLDSAKKSVSDVLENEIARICRRDEQETLTNNKE